MALTCPQCAAQMNEVTASAAVGYLILLDQCPRCGGIWCDRWELYPLTAAAAARLDPVDQEALWQAAAPVREPLTCRRCGARLQPFRDRSLPEEARIERCPNCDGMWLNRGELRRFKQRDASAAAAHRTLSDAQLDRLALQTSRDGNVAPVRNLAEAFDASASEPDSTTVSKELLTSAAWLVARAALRLLLRI